VARPSQSAGRIEALKLGRVGFIAVTLARKRCQERYRPGDRCATTNAGSPLTLAVAGKPASRRLVRVLDIHEVRKLQSLNDQVVSGSRVSPVWARRPSSRSVRYWMALSRCLMIACRWSTPFTARLPMLRFRWDHTPSVGLRSGA